VKPLLSAIVALGVERYVTETGRRVRREGVSGSPASRMTRMAPHGAVVGVREGRALRDAGVVGFGDFRGSHAWGANTPGTSELVGFSW
jgi:hypothetical protein